MMEALKHFTLRGATASLGKVSKAFTRVLVLIKLISALVLNVYFSHFLEEGTKNWKTTRDSQ